MPERTRSGSAPAESKEAVNGGHDVGEAEPLAKRALAPRTRGTYAQSLRALEEWLAGRPVTDETLAEHLQVLYDRGLAASSATNVVAAVKNLAKTEGTHCPVGPKTRRVA